MTISVVLVLMAATILGAVTFNNTNSDNDSDIAINAPWDGKLATGFAGGNGTSSSPYLIADASQFAFMADAVNNNRQDMINGGKFGDSNKYYRLSNNIELNDISNSSVWSDGLAPKNSWVPIGNSAQYFAGTFDGAGFVISGIYISIASYY
ncbi:MAG: hypothetical protein LBE48_06065, partial [Methanomassiliicoccaceae archaeon]|nr:hypothetical protein [Methanomassiliicoccaceae archaeon]